MQLIFASGSTRKENLCPLQSQWFGSSQQITVATVTFVWIPQLQEECQEKRNRQWSIQMFHQLCAPYLMEKNYQFLCHQNPTLWWWSWRWPGFRWPWAINVGWPDFEPPHSSPEPRLISQSELNDLVRDLELPKSKVELLGSRLQQWTS